MPKTKTTDYTLADVGNRESVFTQHPDGTITCLYRPTDTNGTTHPSTFSTSDLISAWTTSAAHMAGVKAAFPTVDDAGFIAALQLVIAATLAHGDHSSGFEA